MAGLRGDQEKSAKFRALKEALQEGLTSGVSEKTVREIWEEAEAQYKSKNA